LLEGNRPARFHKSGLDNPLRPAQPVNAANDRPQKLRPT
jgi:hypothetical protein